MILQMERAVGHAHAADEAAPLVGALQQQAHGVRHGTEQKQDAARHVGGGIGGLGNFHDVDGGVPGAVQK